MRSILYTSEQQCGGKFAWLSKAMNFATPIMKTAIAAMGAIPMVQKGDDAGMNEKTWEQS